MPDQGAPIVQHIVSGNYGFNTRLLMTFTDENSQSSAVQYSFPSQGNYDRLFKAVSAS